ncbi:hypothetical protein GUJ93_ZPchr0007g4966 [Zizania palustris]|uniref:Uncharacterized protein n=1 Tax=Zizania palustris TaxID=103762 RepID=A0A8J5TE31_ZIZPA|nr:hypothetical protein GUJ93_ZPchr0007g4966 [Zizania palustris]
MAGNTEDDEDTVTPTLEDLSAEDRTKIEAKMKELAELMLGEYVRIGDGFVNRGTGSTIFTTTTKVISRSFFSSPEFKQKVATKVEEVISRMFTEIWGLEIESRVKAKLERLGFS